MRNFIVGSIFGFIVAIAAMVFSDPAYFAGRLPAMSEGTYHVYNVKPAFDNAGNSVFWITASKMRKPSINLDSEEIKLYSISRNRVVDPTTFEKLPSPMAGNLVKVLAGTAMVAIR